VGGAGEGEGEMDGAREREEAGEIEGEREMEEAGEIEGEREMEEAGESEGEREMGEAGEMDGVREMGEAGEIEGEGLGGGGSMSCLLAASIRTFSCERKGITRIASYKGRGATAKIAGLMLVQDLEGMET